MIANTVKTEAKAIELLNDGEYAGAVKRTTCECACGETLCIMIGTTWVGVCGSCGDDDAFADDVLVTI